MEWRGVLACLLLTWVSACRWGFDDITGDAGGGSNEVVAELCTDTWCWQRVPTVEQRSLRAISGSSATDVWAVGDGGAIRRWDGNAWTAMQSPTNDALVAVSVLSPTDVTVAAGAGRLWHHDGVAWTMSMTPSGSSAWALWRAPDSSLWAAGDVGTVSVDGVALPSISPFPASTGLHGTSTTNVWHAGVFSAVARWTGSSWTVGAAAEYPTAVWARSTGGAFLGGASIWLCDATLNCVPQVGNAKVAGMFGFGDDDVWTVGDQGAIRHWDGTTWHILPDATPLSLTAVWGAAPDDVWAVGEQGAIVHWNGATWTNLGPTAVTGELGYGALWVGADDDLWMSGNNMWHSDGGQPVSVPMPAGISLSDEIAGAANDLYAADSTGNQLLHFDGSSWQLDYKLANRPLALAATANEVIASDINGSIYTKSQSGVWGPSFATPGSELHALCISEAGVAIAVGRFGNTAVRTAGTWARNDPPTGRFLLGCDFTEDIAWAAGADAVMRFEAGAWTALGTTIRTGQSMQDVLAISPSEVYIVGTNGRVMRFDGSAWSEEAMPVASYIGKITTGSSGSIYAVGRFPGILRRR